jgi:hypothetical protein
MKKKSHDKNTFTEFDLKDSFNYAYTTEIDSKIPLITNSMSKTITNFNINSNNYRQNISLSSFENNNTNENLNNKYKLKYMPKRKFNWNIDKNPFIFLKEDNKKSNKKRLFSANPSYKKKSPIIINENNNKNFYVDRKNVVILKEENKLNIDEEINKHTYNDILQFRNEFIFKYAHIAEKIDKLNTDYKSHVERQNEFKDFYYSIKKVYEIINNLLLNKLKCDEILNFSLWKDLISYHYNFFIIICDFIDFIFEENIKLKDEKEKFRQKNFEMEMNLNSKIDELNRMNLYLKKYDYDSKLNNNKKNENKIYNEKKRFQIKENDYKIKIYNLEEEIKNLTKLLNINKVSELKLFENENNLKTKEEELKKIKDIFNNDLNELNVKNNMFKDVIENLKYENKKLEETIKNKNEEIDKEKQEKINYKIKYESLEDFIKEKDNLIFNLEDKIKILEQNNNNINNFKENNMFVRSSFTTAKNV